MPVHGATLNSKWLKPEFQWVPGFVSTRRVLSCGCAINVEVRIKKRKQTWRWWELQRQLKTGFSRLLQWTVLCCFSQVSPSFSVSKWNFAGYESRRVFLFVLELLVYAPQLFTIVLTDRLSAPRQTQTHANIYIYVRALFSQSASLPVRSLSARSPDLSRWKRSVALTSRLSFQPAASHFCVDTLDMCKSKQCVWVILLMQNQNWFVVVKPRHFVLSLKYTVFAAHRLQVGC